MRANRWLEAGPARSVASAVGLSIFGSSTEKNAGLPRIGTWEPRHKQLEERNRQPCGADDSLVSSSAKDERRSLPGNVEPYVQRAAPGSHRLISFQFWFMMRTTSTDSTPSSAIVISMRHQPSPDGTAKLRYRHSWLLLVAQQLIMHEKSTTPKTCTGHQLGNTLPYLISIYKIATCCTVAPLVSLVDQETFQTTLRACQRH